MVRSGKRPARFLFVASSESPTGCNAACSLASSGRARPVEGPASQWEGVSRSNTSRFGALPPKASTASAARACPKPARTRSSASSLSSLMTLSTTVELESSASVRASCAARTLAAAGAELPRPGVSKSTTDRHCVPGNGSPCSPIIVLTKRLSVPTPSMPWSTENEPSDEPVVAQRARSQSEKRLSQDDLPSRAPPTALSTQTGAGSCLSATSAGS
mmetsp:Transcript_34077/g.110078  ORF Transcript_34077/g.110078 Transcript_34077/m.110078 type:complete len:216 (+) Transcript_34077:2129-2776(+)|eukprot:scaffold20031_cov111-Isochrysis_galbana.AAC.3